MRSMLAATALMLVAASATAQTAPPKVEPKAEPKAQPKTQPKPAPNAAPKLESKPESKAESKPAAAAKPPATVAAKPAGPADPAGQAERLALQSDLAWAADYNGAISGEANERMNAAIRTFQKNNNGATTGTLTPQQRALLAAAAKTQQDNVGWKIVSDAATGTRLGVPLKLVPQQASNADGTRWASTTGTIQVLVSRRKDAVATIAAIAEREKKEPAGRRIDYTAVRPDFFVLSGMQGLKKFYIRGQIKDGDVRLMTVLYDQATEGTMAPVVIAMSSAFTPFPAGVQAGVPAPRKKVEYATGVVVGADGVIVTDRAAVEACQSIVVQGHGNAERFADDKRHDLALLRLYGARGLVPAGLGGRAAASAVDLIGISDPQNQGGGSAISAMKAQVSPAASGDPMLSPAPEVGFSGAAARDGDGNFAGIALLKPAVVAGPVPAASQAVLVPVDALRSVLKTRNVTINEAAGGDAKASVVRVICVRK